MKKDKALVLLSCVVFFLVLLVGISTSNSVKVDEKGNTKVNAKKNEVKGEGKLSVSLNNLSSGQVVEGAEIVSEVINEEMVLKDGVIKVHNPGDYVTYTFDVINNGDVNTELSLIDIPGFTCTSLDGNTEVADKVCRSVDIDLNYTNLPQKVVEMGDSLARGTTTSFTMTIIYNNGPDVLENVNVEVSDIELTLGYKQNNLAKTTVGQKN